MKFSAACIRLFVQSTLALGTVGGIILFASFSSGNHTTNCVESHFESIVAFIKGVVSIIEGAIAGSFIALCVISIAAAINAGVLAARKAKATKP